MKKKDIKSEETINEKDSLVEEQEVNMEASEEKAEGAVNNPMDELAEAKDKYLRLYSEFDNFRRRTAKERMELIGTASRDLMEQLLPILDDFDRASQSANSEKATLESVKEGVDLIHQKINKTLEGKGLKRMAIKQGDDFNPELHEAITQIPADAKLEGKIVDVIEPGFFLQDTVVRFAKVVLGAKA